MFYYVTFLYFVFSVYFMLNNVNDSNTHNILLVKNSVMII